MINKNKITNSTGNVFEDLGLPNPEERLAKAELALTVNDIIKRKKITQKEAAKMLGIDQPKVSKLARGQLAEFSLQRLIRFLNRLSQDIEIVVHERSLRRKSLGYLHVTFDHAGAH